MAQAGIYAPATVIDADVVVRVNGIVREHASMDWAGDTTGGLPDQVVSAGTGMRSRTGTIRWAQQDVVQADPPHPLRRTGGWPPREGDKVVIDATVDTGQGPYSFRRFTGRIDRTTGSLTDGTLTSEITDTLGDSLQAVCSIPPAILGLYSKSQQIAYRAMEQAGLGALPPPDQWTVGHVGGQGGNDASVGSVDNAVTSIGSGDPYGLMATTGLRLIPTTTVRGTNDVLVMGRASTAWDSSLSVSLTNGTEVTLTHRIATKTLHLFVSGVGHVWEGPTLDDSPLPVLAIQTLKAGTRVYTSRTTWVDAPGWTIPTNVGVRWAEGTYLIGRSIRLVSSDPAIVSATPWLPAGWLGSALESEFLPASRSIENVPARQVVDAWSEATLASVWMDEHGKPWCVARDQLLARPVSRTLRVDERVLAGSWTVGDDQVRSGVIVKGQQVAIDRPRADEHRALVYQEGSTRTVEEPEVIERFIEAPPEEEWGPIDLTASRWQGNSAVQGTLPATGTWIHAVVVHDSGAGDEDHWAWDNAPNPSTYDIVIERLGHRTLKVTETVAPGFGVEAVYLKSPERKDNQHPGWIRSAYRDIPSPIIRGEWTTTWADYTVTGSTTGPTWAPPLEHDAGWWLTPANAQRFADALAAEVTQAMPTLDGVTVLWDPTRQIGDVETWIATDSAGNESWRARVLVTGYSEKWDGNVPTQSVDVRVISWTDPTSGKTYDDLLRVYGRYHQIEGYQPTYGQLYDALPDHF